MKRFFLLFFALFVSFFTLNAQYYGRNKIKYEQFNFKIYQTQHFKFYYYFDDSTTIKRIADIGEKWYARHSKVFKDTINFLNPVIVFANHADFQQNTIISGIIDVGTGGVTEGMQNRVVLPTGVTWGRTDHVLGHELVHAFQYASMRQDTTLGVRAMMNVPLWMVEGMAEYLSIGSLDPFTAMWIRDAVANDYFPRLKDLWDQQKYFPYRWGQAFWAFIDGVYGPDMIYTLFKRSAAWGYRKGIKKTLGVSPDTLQEVWKDYVYKQYKPYLKDRWLTAPGKLVAGEKENGKVSLLPAVSPDGKHFVFLSTRDIFTFDMFLADAKTGKIIRKLALRANDGHIDAADVYESSGTWSPDSKRFAYVIYEKGNNMLSIVDVATGRITDEISIPGVDAFTNPAWSPDGKSIIVSAIHDGQTDLVQYFFDTKKVKWLTNDIYGQIQAQWSPDGKYLAFVTDYVPGEKSPSKKLHLAIMDMATGQITIPNVFPEAYDMSPVFGGDSKTVYFVSDVEGFRDIYSYNIETRKVTKLTNFFTGVSGMSMMSPALSFDYKTNRLFYNYYFNNTYQIYSVDADSLAMMNFDRSQREIAGNLPPNQNLNNYVDSAILSDNYLFDNLPDVKGKFVPYKRKFLVESIGNIGFNTGNSYFGMGVYGGLNVLVGDVLGENRMFLGISGSGDLDNLGGQLAYYNQKRRTWWGASLSHNPYNNSMVYYVPDTLAWMAENGVTDTINVINAKLDVLTIFEDNLSLFASYPLTQTRRIEASASFSYYWFSHKVYNNYYCNDARYCTAPVFLGMSIDTLETPPGFNVNNFGLAFIEDDSYFGMTSPMKGKITYLGINGVLGAINLYNADIDIRRYYYVRPVSFAFRLMQSYRFGKDAESGAIPDYYVISPWYIHGYTNAALVRYMQYGGSEQIIYGFLGSRMAVANAEVRLPVVGVDRLALIKSKYLFADFNAFFDAGLAWHSYESVALQHISTSDNVHTPVMSTGVSLRINLFGQIIIEPYYAYPLSLPGFKGGVLGINFGSGW